MSLRGKLEAVLYAAEEPVTLAQLVMLFGEEALEEQRVATSGDQGSVISAASAQTGVFPFRSDDPATRLEDEHTPPGSSDIPSDTPPVGLDGPGDRTARARQRAARAALSALLQAAMEEGRQQDRGVEIREIAGGYQVATKPEYHDAIRVFARSLKPPMKLSLQALETLAVIAYKQPVTGPEISEIRGVDSGGVLGSLIGRKLVTTAGRKQVVGRPILYKTTREFLLRFGLKDLLELPSMEEFEKMAGELEERDEQPDDLQGTGPIPEAESGSLGNGAVD